MGHVACPTKKSLSQLTRDDGDRSTDVPQLLPGEVFDQAADQSGLSHLGGADDDNHNGRRFQRSPVHQGDVVFFGFYVLSPERKSTGGEVLCFLFLQKLLLGFAPGWMSEKKRV